MTQSANGLVMCAGLAMGWFALGGFPAAAQDKTWDGDGGNLLWFDGSNWDPDGEPEVFESVLVDAGGPVEAASQTVSVLSMEVLSGLNLVSSGINLAGPSRIVGLGTAGCCRPVIEHDSTLTIEGTSILSKAASFRGSGTTLLDGTILNDSELYARDTHSAIIAGEMEMTPNGALQPWDSAQIIVQGTVTGVGSSGVGRVVGAGEVVNRGTIQILTPGLMRFVGSVQTESPGRILADQGEIELTGESHFNGGTIEARNGGTVEVIMGADSDIRDVTMEGDGEVYVQTGRAVFNGTSTANMAFPGQFLIRNPLQIGGTLRNTGNMVLFGATLRDASGSGALETTGFVDVQVGSTLEIPVTVQDGGTFQPRANVSLRDVLTIESGGQLSFNEVGVVVSDVGGRIVNSGQVRLDESLDAYGDRVLVEVHPAFEMRPGGEVKQLGGFLRMLGGGDLSGGVFTMDEDGAGISLRGDGQTWHVSGEVAANGSGDFTLGGGGGRTTIDLAGTMRLNVTGFNNIGSDLRALVRGQGELVNEAKATIDDGDSNGFRLESTFRNAGEVRATANFSNAGTIVNEGTWEHSVGGGITFEGGTAQNEGAWLFGEGAFSSDFRASPSGSFVNNGTFEAVALPNQPHNHRIFIAFTNNGTVRASAAYLEFHDATNLVNGRLQGGTWIAENQGWIAFPGSTVSGIGPGTNARGSRSTTDWIEDVTTIEGELTCDGADFNNGVEVRGGTFRVLGDTTVPSVRTTDGGKIQVGEGVELDSTGEITLPSVIDDLETVASIGLIGDPARLVTPRVDLSGRLIPGGEGRAGQFDIIGELLVRPGGEMLFDVGGTDNTDVVTVTGGVTLDDATVRVSLIDEFQPLGGESYTLVSAAGGLSGAFATLDLPPLGGGLEWDVSYTSTEVILGVGSGCVADWNQDGVVNTLDFLAYLNLWTTGDSAADINADGNVNTLDFLEFLNLWTTGC